jgi:hypothetical protein
MNSNVNIAALPPMVEDALTGLSARRIFVRRYDNDDATTSWRWCMAPNWKSWG